MRVTVKGKNVEVTDALEKYAQKKVEHLGKYFSNIKEATVTQSTQRNWHIVEVMLEGDGIVLRGEERSDDMYSSIDQVVAKLESQIKRFKSKLIERSHTSESPREAGLTEIEETAEESVVEAPQIVRMKRFALKPMPPEEASAQMELLGHDFYVFENSDTEVINVIYKRRDGNYGLLEPEV